MKKLFILIVLGLFLVLPSFSQTYVSSYYKRPSITVVIDGDYMTVTEGIKVRKFTKSVQYSNRTTFKNYKGDIIEVKFKADGSIEVDGTIYKKRK